MPMEKVPFSKTDKKAQGLKPGEFYFFYFTEIINCKYVPQKQITKHSAFDPN
jgi:hypothetical protein